MACGAVTTGQVEWTERGIIIHTERPGFDDLSDSVSVVWHDKRKISPEQMRKAHAIIGEICEWAGYYGAKDHENLNQDLKYRFLHEHTEILDKQFFSLSDCDMTTAREYISYLIEFCLRNEVPTKVPLVQLCDDIEKYVYACLMSKKCAVCGEKTELHHVDHVGMGYNRKEIDHIGMRCLPLCHEHHMEVHTIGQSVFDEKYHIVPIEIDERIAKKYRLGRNEKSDAQ